MTTYISFNNILKCFSKGEGAAYRGRILVELSTKLDRKAEKEVEAISNDDILVAQVITSVEILMISGPFVLRVAFACHFYSLIYFIEIPAKEEVLPVCCVPQCHHDTRARRAYSV